MNNISEYSPRSGRIIRENNTIVNEADGIEDDGSRRVKLMGRNLSQAFTVLNGQQLSNNYVDLGGKVLVALSFPAGITQTSLSFQSCDTPGGTYQDVYDSFGNLVTVQIGAGRVVAVTGIALQALSALQYIKIKLIGSAVTGDKTVIAMAKG